MSLVFTILHGIATVFLPYLLYEAFLERKDTWPPTKTLLLIIALGVIFNFVAPLIETSMTFVSIARMLLSGMLTCAVLAAMLVPFYGSIKKKATLVGLAFCLFAAGELVGTFIFWLFAQQSLFPMLENDLLAREIIILLSLACTLLMIAGIRYFTLKNKRPPKYNFFYRMELFVPLMAVSVIIYLATLRQEASLNIGSLVLLLAVLTFYVYNFYYQQTMLYEWREHQRQMDNQQTQFREQHYRELEAHQAEIHTIKHDLKNQLIAMDAYVRAGASGQAAEQIGSLIAQLENRTRFFTQNAGVNGLLAQKYQQAEEAGILAQFSVSLPLQTEFADADIVALLGNILDNAIEACLYCERRRFIKLEVVYQDGVFILKSENSTDGKAPSTKTRKMDAAHHGYGLESIRRIVEKYNGEMQYHFLPGSYALEATLFGTPSAGSRT